MDRWLRAIGIIVGIAALCAFAARWALRRVPEQAIPSSVRATTLAAVPAESVAPKPAALPPCASVVVPRGDSLWLDDMEDENARAISADGRDGFWYIANDGSGVQEPTNDGVLHPTRLPKPRAGSRHALHTRGEGFRGWGASVALRLATGACYDVSRYAGIRFFARGKSRVHVGLKLIESIWPNYGGTCERPFCAEGFRKIVVLGHDWQEHSVRWEELEPDSPKPQESARLRSAEFRPDRVFKLDFLIYPEDMPFDLWIDDVRFLER